MNRKTLFTFIQYACFLGLGVGLVWWQFNGMGQEARENFFRSLKEANYWIVLPIIVLAIISFWARSQRWRIMIEPMGYNPKLSNTFCSTMIGYLVNAAVPRLGEIVKCTFLSRYEKIPVDKLIGTIVVERMFDVVCYIIFIGITLSIELKKVRRFAHKNLQQTGPGFNWTKLLIVIGAIILVGLLFRWIFKRYGNNKLVKKIKHIVANLEEGMLSIKNLQRRKGFLLYTLLIWGMYLFEIYIGFNAMDATTGLTLGTACSALMLATLAMIVLPGGFGAFPVFISKVLVMYGVKAADGNAFGWLMWGVSTGITILFGFFCLLVIPSINKNYHPIETNIGHPE